MTNSSAQFVSLNFAEFLLENATNGNEILAVLDDLYEVQSTPLLVTQIIQYIRAGLLTLCPLYYVRAKC